LAEKKAHPTLEQGKGVTAKKHQKRGKDVLEAHEERNAFKTSHQGFRPPLVVPIYTGTLIYVRLKGSVMPEMQAVPHGAEHGHLTHEAKSLKGGFPLVGGPPRVKEFSDGKLSKPAFEATRSSARSVWL
jgi:hypothetical protein